MKVVEPKHPFDNEYFHVLREAVSKKKKQWLNVTNVAMSVYIPDYIYNIGSYRVMLFLDPGFDILILAGYS